MGVISCGTTMLDQGQFENLPVVNWDTTVKTANFTAVSGNGYFVNTTSAAITVTLPASPSAGDQIAIKDYAGTFATNNVTAARNGSNINGLAVDGILSTSNLSVILLYVDATKGWSTISSSSQVVDGATYLTASGGTVSTDGNFKVHTFTGPGTFEVLSLGNPSGSITVDYLVTAGGGGGGVTESGGGGAGGYRESFPNPGAGGFPVSVTSYPITVGAGGAGATPGPQIATSGSNSIFSSITSAGGGRGGFPASSGGSGGGGNRGATGASGNTPPVTPPQGNNGGPGAIPNGADFGGGGGGGASAVGSPGTCSAGGDGGDGTASSITGSSVTRAGGGGGGKGETGGGLGGTGGAGGGGNGGAGLPQPAPTGMTSGTANTGGGGGGAGGDSGVATATGGDGGSGIVIIRYKFQ